ncbi:hypothetical protein BC830DRAFT_763202 [Chytriomyces sp. MP71]|nr:hypothetical protein BC830DRAFT_763202 [Chytriomyces sp. MP71]
MIAAVLTFLGLYLVVFGGNGTYLSVYANGFMSVSSFCVLLTWNVEPLSGYSQRAALYLAVYFITGFVGGLLFGFIPFIGHLLACAYYGLLIGIQLLCLASGGIFSTILGRQLFLIPFVIAALLFSMYHPKHVLSALSGFSGMFIVILGIDLWAQTGLFVGVAAFMTLSEVGAWQASLYVFDQPKMIMVSVSMVFGAIAGVFQYRAAIRKFGSGPKMGLEAGTIAIFTVAS